MCRECDPSRHGAGYLIVVAVLLGLCVTIFAMWRVVAVIRADL